MSPVTMQDTLISDTMHHGEEMPDQEESSPPIIQEYEDLVHTIQLQLKQCQDEQESLRTRLESVVQENQSLSEQLQSELSKHASSEVCAKSLNNNIKMQLDAAIQERNAAVEMWQTSLQLITALENELKDYRDNSHLTSAVEKIHEVRAEYSRAISLLEEKLAAASTRLAKEKATREMAEAKIEQLGNDYQLLMERYEKRCTDVDEALVVKQTYLKKIEALEKNYGESVIDSKEAKLACSELEAALERSLAHLEEVLTKEAEAREKVDEALQIVEVALIERDNALSQATQASEEAQQLRSSLNELIKEAGSEVRAEAEQIKEHFNSRIKTVLLDMRRLQAENKNKNSQIQKLKSDLNSMEAQLQRSKHELDNALKDRSSLCTLDRKLDGLFRTHELAGGDALRADLELEQQRVEIVKLNQSNELQQRQHLLERHVLEEQIKLLQTEIEKSSQIVSEYSARNDVLNCTLRQKEHEILLLKKAFASNILPHQLFDKRSPHETDSKVMEQIQLWDDGQKMLNELQSQLDSQRDLANKWKREVNLITSRFQSRLRELHSETLSLRRENREIHNLLHAARYQLQIYQKSVNEIAPVIRSN